MVKEFPIHGKRRREFFKPLKTFSREEGGDEPQRRKGRRERGGGFGSVEYQPLQHDVGAAVGSSHEWKERNLLRKKAERKGERGRSSCRREESPYFLDSVPTKKEGQRPPQY